MKNKDWDGNKASTFKCLGASNHCEHDRENNDYYATDPIAAKLLLEVEPDLNNIWEPACGEGHLAKVFDESNKLGLATDLIDRGYGNQLDLFDKRIDNSKWDGDIVTNPPYKFAEEFVRRSIDLITDNHKVCMFLKLTFLEGKGRKQLFIDYPLKTLYVSSSRIKCALGGDFGATGSSAVAYGWYIWEKGYKGDTIVKWIN